MMYDDSIKATGQLNITLRDSSNNIKLQTTVPNLVVTVGKNAIAARLIGTSVNVMSHMAVGESSLNLATANTGLDDELSRVALTSSTRTDNVITYSATYDAGVATGALVEAGIFNASSSGTMLCRTTFPVINKESTDVLTINWNVTIN